MSDYVVQRFFAKESLLQVSLGQDGLMGYFTSNYPTIVAMARSIQDQEIETLERKKESYLELQDLRDELEFLDYKLTKQSKLNTADKKRHADLEDEIDFHEKELEREDPIFFRGESLRMCGEYEFITKMNCQLPGLMDALVEFDRLLRLPIAKIAKKGIGWATLPLKTIVGAIISRSDLGVAGNLIYMLVDQYPELIRERMVAEEPSGKPADYDPELDGYNVKEFKKEKKLIWKHPKDDDK